MKTDAALRDRKSEVAKELKNEGLTQTEIADVLGVHRNSVSNWLNS